MPKKCTTSGHVSKAIIVRKAKSGFSAGEAKRECDKINKGLFSIDLPHFIKIFGPKHKQILSAFVPSAVTYGITSLICICYLTEWKAVLQYLPLYRGKYFQPKEPEQKKC